MITGLHNKIQNFAEFLVLIISIAYCLHKKWKYFDVSPITLLTNFLSNLVFHTLSGRIGKVAAAHAAVARSIPAEVALIYTMHEALRGYCPWGWGCNQSIGSTASDSIVRSWLWLTATRKSPFGCFSTLLQVVDNWPHILW